MKKTILILAANPQNSARLRLDREVREIQDRLQRSRLRHQFELEQRWAVQPRDMQRSLLEVKPYIVHFSGHGEGEAGLVLQDTLGKMKLVSSAALSNLFRLCADSIECVFLNACYAEVQANAIVQHIDFVIGMQQAVRDDVAIAFAAGFYAGLGDGLAIEAAFEQGRQAIRELLNPQDSDRAALPEEYRKLFSLDALSSASVKLPDLPDDLIPVLKRRQAD